MKNNLYRSLAVASVAGLTVLTGATGSLASGPGPSQEQLDKEHAKNEKADQQKDDNKKKDDDKKKDDKKKDDKKESPAKDETRTPDMPEKKSSAKRKATSVAPSGTKKDPYPATTVKSWSPVRAAESVSS